MEFKNTLLGLALLTTQALLGSAAGSGFGSPVQSPRSLREGFGVHSPLTVGSAAAVGSQLRSNAFSPTEDEMARLAVAAASAFKKEEDAQQKVAALQSAAAHASLTTDAPVQPKLDAALSTDDDSLSTDASDGAIAAAATPSIKADPSLKPTAAPQTVASIALATAVLAPAKPKVDATASAAALAVALAAQHKDRKEQALAPKWVKRMARFKRTGDEHTYEVPVEYDENDAHTRTISTQAKIAASLWHGIKYNLSVRNRVRCSGPFCKQFCNQKLEAEECEVSVHDLAPKTVEVHVSIGQSVGQGECVRTVYGQPLHFSYDLHEPTLVQVGNVCSESARFSSTAVSASLVQALCRQQPYLNPRYLDLFIEDLQPDVCAAPVVCPPGDRWTRIVFSSPTVKCSAYPDKTYSEHCNFILDPETGLNKADKDTQNKVAKELALQAVRNGNTKCYHCQSSSSSQLAHSTDKLAVSICFPKDWGSA